MKDWKALKAELLKNPQFKKEYEKSEREYQTARASFKSAQGLLALARWAEKEHVRGPKDLSDNHNKYIWE